MKHFSAATRVSKPRRPNGKVIERGGFVRFRATSSARIQFQLIISISIRETFENARVPDEEYPREDSRKLCAAQIAPAMELSLRKLF